MFIHGIIFFPGHFGVAGIIFFFRLPGVTCNILVIYGLLVFVLRGMRLPTSDFFFSTACFMSIHSISLKMLRKIGNVF